MSEPREADTQPARPSLLLGAAHLAALWALAVVQPLLSLLGGNPEFFVARDNTGTEIVVFAILALVLPPLIALLAEALLNLVSRPARWALHLGLIGLLFAILVLQFLKQVMDGPGAVMIVACALGGAGLAWAYGHRRFLRSLADILTPAPLVILIVFLFFSQSADTIASSGDVQAIKTSVGNPAPVVMVVFDEFPAGSLMTPDGGLNAARFPNFAELASQSDWYRNTTTGASYTTIAIPAILSGKSSERDSIPTADDHPETLFTLLGKRYRINSLEPITQLCPPSICDETAEDEDDFTGAIGSLFTDSKVIEEHLLLPDDMNQGLPDISQTFGGFDDPTLAVAGESPERLKAREFVAGQHREMGGALTGEEETRKFLAGLGPSDRPKFDYGHVEKPHYPWNHYPDGAFYGRTTEDFRAFIPDELTWQPTPYVNERATQAHLLEVGYVDHLLGGIIDRLKRRGVWDESLVVITADHGGALIPGQPRREANDKTIGQIATVPLFIKRPSQTSGRVIERHTCSTEILPTVARVLEVDVPWETTPCDRHEVAVDNGTGPVATAPIARVLEERQNYVNRVAGLFGGDTGWPSVLRLGPNKDLIGTRLATLAIDPADTGTLHPDFGGDGLTDYDPGRVDNPVLRQRGTIDGAAEGDDLAVVVNGRVAAVGRVYAESGNPSYSILLPQEALRTGRNGISIFKVDRGSGATTLSRLAWPSDQ